MVCIILSLSIQRLQKVQIFYHNFNLLQEKMA